MKKCVKCGIEKEYEFFNKRKVAKDGLHPYCKECVSQIMKIYGNNKEVKLRAKEWKNNNSEKVKIHAKNSYYKNHEKRLEKVKTYNEKNREKINEKQRIYNLKNKIVINEKQNEFWSSEIGNFYANEYYHRTKERFDEKIKARNKLRYAVQVGKIIKPDFCEKCLKQKKLEGHHTDYSKPLDVTWVCGLCHRKIEREGN